VDNVVLKDVFDSLDVMWKGMLGLFLVCAAVAVLTIIVSKCTKEKAKKAGRD
jgi:hypothetical protein